MRTRQRAFTLAEIMLVVALIGFLIAIAVPTFFSARELSRQRACQENLHKVDASKEQWTLDLMQGATATPTWADLVGVTRYMRKSPTCPSGGTYSINTVDEDPTCTYSTDTRYGHTFEVRMSGGT